jgi:hypothetical protein
MSSNWVVTWNACFGALSKQRADSIEVFINNKVGGDLSGQEMDLAIERIANDPNGKAPSVPSIIAFIQEARKRARGIDTSEPYEVTKTRRSIVNMEIVGLDRWDTICNLHDKYHGQFTSRAISDAMNSGGLTIPWWANANNIRHTAQEPKPKGVTSMRDLLSKGLQTLHYIHGDNGHDL